MPIPRTRDSRAQSEGRMRVLGAKLPPPQIEAVRALVDARRAAAGDPGQRDLITMSSVFREAVERLLQDELHDGQDRAA